MKIVVGLLVSISALLAGCGGGGSSGGGGGGGGGDQTPVADVKKILGAVAIGAGMGNLPVEIKDANGNSPCIESTITTDASGNYQCTLKTPMPPAPYFVHASDTTGTTTDLYSVVAITPTSTTTTVNVTPITTAIIAQAHDVPASVIYADTSKFINQDLERVKAYVLTQIAQVSTALGINNYDPFVSTIVAATSAQTGNKADLVLDTLKISKNGKQDYVFHSIGNTEAIKMATKTDSGSPVFAPTVDNFDGLSAFLKNSAAKFNACAALPSNQRIKRNAQGVFQSIDSKCLTMVSVAEPISGVPDFKHHAQSIDWFFWDWLGDGINKDVWINGIFMPPEIMAFCKANTNCNRTSRFDVRYPRDRAWINIKLKDSGGNNPLNFITVAQNYGSPDQPNWQITGDQSDADHQIKAGLWRVEDWTPLHGQQNCDNSATPPPPSNASVRFKVTLEPRIDKYMPNSDQFDAVKVEGPGLPSTGLWYHKEANSSLFTMAKERTVYPTVNGYKTAEQGGQTVTFTPVCQGCLSFVMGIATSATDLAQPNPNQSNIKQYALGASEGSYNGQDDSLRPKAGDFYKFSAYKLGVLYRVEYERLLSDLQDPRLGNKVLWMTPGSDILAALDSRNQSLNPTSSVSSLKLNWNLPKLGSATITEIEPIKNVWVSQSDGGYENSSKLKIGDKEIIATPLAGQTFTSIHAGCIREIGIEHRMMDGSTKTSNYFYDSTW